MDTISTNILVSGNVQGVGFRYATKQKADYLNLKGWVKNLEDGRVEIQADGTNRQVEKLISAINHNLTPISHVSHIEVTEVISEEAFSGFSII